MSKIVFIPLDERPCNYIYPDYIGRMSGLELSMPRRRFWETLKRRLTRRLSGNGREDR